MAISEPETALPVTIDELCEYKPPPDEDEEHDDLDDDDLDDDDFDDEDEDEEDREGAGQRAQCRSKLRQGRVGERASGCSQGLFGKISRKKGA